MTTPQAHPDTRDSAFGRPQRPSKGAKQKKPSSELSDRPTWGCGDSSPRNTRGSEEGASDRASQQASVGMHAPSKVLCSKGMRGKVERRLSRIRNKKKATFNPSVATISFTFDDVPQSACRTGSKILEEHGFRGSFYVCGGLTDQQGDVERFHSRDDLLGLKDRGHEVASHGYAHLDYQSISLDQVRADLDHNLDFFRELGWSEEPNNFAYPYGCVSPSVKALCATRFASARGIVNAVNRNPCDLALLKSVALYKAEQSAETLTTWIDRVKRSRGWLIFFTHGVLADAGDFDCTPELLEFAIQRATEAGCQVAPISEVLQGLQ